MLKKTVVETCCTGMYRKRDVQRCWREVLEKGLDRKGLERLVNQ